MNAPNPNTGFLVSKSSFVKFSDLENETVKNLEHFFNLECPQTRLKIIEPLSETEIHTISKGKTVIRINYDPL